MDTCFAGVQDKGSASAAAAGMPQRWGDTAAAVVDAATRDTKERQRSVSLPGCSASLSDCGARPREVAANLRVS
jgi:type IV secretory pathway VirB6-like protein